MTNKVIFLSYRRGDSPGYVRNLEKDLEGHFGNGSVFRDVKDISGGSKWKAVIEENIRNSAVLLLIIGPRWDAIWRERIQDKVNYVEYELEYANKNNIPVIPITLDGAYIRDDTDLKSISWLRENQTYDMSDKQGRWDSDFEGLLALLDSFDEISHVSIEPKKPQVSHSEPEQNKQKGKSKSKLRIVTILLLALLAIGGTYFYLSLPQINQNKQNNTGVFSAGFDCKKAGTQIERVICDNPNISRVDGQLGFAYEELSVSLSSEEFDKLKFEQRQWLKKRDSSIRNNCVISGELDSSCVVKIYQKRIAYLKSLKKEISKSTVFPDISGAWRSKLDNSVYIIEHSSSEAKFKITGYADGEGYFNESLPNKIHVLLYKLGKGEFSLSNSKDEIMGVMNFNDGSKEYDTLVKIK